MNTNSRSLIINEMGTALSLPVRLGLAIGVPGTVIGSARSSSLVAVGSKFFLDSISTGSGPSLKTGGVDVVAGQFGGWTPIGAEQTASGHRVAWKPAE